MSVTVPGLFRAGAVHSKCSLLASVCFNLRLVRKQKIVIRKRYMAEVSNVSYKTLTAQSQENP